MKANIIILLIIGIILSLSFIVYSFKKLLKKPVVDNLYSGSEFYIEDNKKYAIWGKTRLRKTNNLIKESPIIIDRIGYEMDLKKVIMPMSITKFKYGMTKLYTVYLQSGQYRLETINTPYSTLGKFVHSLTRDKQEQEYEEVEYVIKENLPTFFFFLSIWAIILTIGMILVLIFIIVDIIPIN